MRNNFIRSIFGLVVFLVTICILLSGCAQKSNYRIENIVPRESFVKILAVVEARVCSESESQSLCKSHKMRAYASGVIVHRNENGSEILTAGHVCDTSDLSNETPQVPNTEVTFDVKILVSPENGEQFESDIIRIDTSIDSCLLHAKTMNRWKPIRIRTEPVKHGEILYNIASPLGVATPEMVPVLNGHYSGDMSFTRSAYTIPAAPGSSGSPIFDKRGKLVGMVHSVYIRFPFLSFGPTQKRLLDFLDH
tara:strand:+ start:924 stop:1673 length:750 start_codon:yes stop_codon:yes gene_type:complete